MRALLGWFLALGLLVTPAMAGTDEPAGNTASSDAATTSASSKPAATSKAEASSLEGQLDELRDLLESQSKQLNAQNEQLKATQQKMQLLQDELNAANAAGKNLSAAPATEAPGNAVSSSSASGTSSTAVAAASASGSSSGATPAANSAASVTAAAAPQKPSDASPLGIKIGSATLTPLGFMDLTNVFRNRTIGSGIGTNFAGAPYTIASNYPAAGLTEDRFSAQNSRIGFRFDSTVAGGEALGYLEADFLGNAASSLSVTSNSATLRLRVYFVDYKRGMWEVLGGQDWSMLTPNRAGIDPVPGGIFYSQDMDTNYQVGLVWERTPQVRFVLHPNKTVALGFSMENPDQYFGGNGGVGTPTSPAGFASGTEVDTTAGSGTNTPNVRPDIIAKIAFDPMIHGRLFHIDVAGVSRQFKVNTFTPASGSAVATSVNSGAEGGGGSFNFNFELFKNFHLIENAFWSDGGGRDIFDLAPDFTVRPAAVAGGPFTISPLHSGSGIGGVEWQVSPKTLLYGYYGLVYVGRDVSLQASTGSTCEGHAGFACVGYGYAGAATAVAESQNRTIAEDTIGWIQTIWRNPNYGALQIITQASYLQRAPWYVVPGTPRSAQAGMGFVDLRYVLP